LKLNFPFYHGACLERRIADVQTLSQEIAIWESDAYGGLRLRNYQKASVNWRFKTTDARKKMGRVYPDIGPRKVDLPDY
jgi:hypothetical protein